VKKCKKCGGSRFHKYAMKRKTSYCADCENKMGRESYARNRKKRAAEDEIYFKVPFKKFSNIKLI